MAVERCPTCGHLGGIPEIIELPESGLLLVTRPVQGVLPLSDDKVMIWTMGTRSTYKGADAEAILAVYKPDVIASLPGPPEEW